MVKLKAFELGFGISHWIKMAHLLLYTRDCLKRTSTNTDTPNGISFDGLIAKVVAGGGWFPETPQGKREREPHYSGWDCS